MRFLLLSELRIPLVLNNNKEILLFTVTIMILPLLFCLPVSQLSYRRAF